MTTASLVYPYARSLSVPAYNAMCKMMSIRRLQRDEVLASESEPCEAVYWVAEGRLRVLKVAPNGREQTLYEAHQGAVLNLVPALDGDPSPATIVAATRSSLFVLSVTALDELIGRYPELARLLLRELAARLREQTNLSAELALRSVGERLARLLVDSVSIEGGLHTTQREMASRLGTVREVLARELARFERRGWIIASRGVIEVVDYTALQHLAEYGDS